MNRVSEIGFDVSPQTTDPHLLATATLRLRALDRSLNRLVADRTDAIVNDTVLHPWSGLEVLSVGVASARQAGDVVFATHRGLGHCLAWGVDAYAAIAEALGRRDGTGLGRSGHMHVVDLDAGVGGTNGIVGASLPLAAGAALAMQVQETDHVAVAFGGDGSTNTGAFHESMNLAAVWGLPLVIVCEDNGITEAMPSAEFTASESMTARAAAYGIPTVEVPGDDLAAIREAAEAAFAHARSGNGPSFVSCRLLRPKGHYAGDQQRYRDREEAAAAASDRPVDRALSRLGISSDDEAELDASAGEAADRLIASVLAGDRPTQEMLRTDESRTATLRTNA